MGLLARIIGLGPLLLAGLVILALLIAFSIPSLMPYIPLLGIIAPVLILGFIAWRRSYPAAVGYLRARVPPEVFWNASSYDLRMVKVVTTDRKLADFHGTAGRVVLFEDESGLRGYACKVLKVADITNTYETTTEDERFRLLEAVAKAIEGLGDVEAKMVIDRSPESGEKAYIILWSEIVDGDEKSAVYSVENAARTLQRGMDRVGVSLIDDISYISPKVKIVSETRRPGRIHALLTGLTSLLTLLSSAICLGSGMIAQTLLLSSVIGLIVSAKLLHASRRAECTRCGRGRHSHMAIGLSEAYQVDEGGVLKEYLERGVVFSRYLSFSGNSNRDLPPEEIDRRLTMNLKMFSTLLYALQDFRVAIHVKPQSPGDLIRVSLAKADFHSMDAAVGGAVSGFYKANKNMNIAERITRGERPYIMSGVVEVRARVDGLDESRVKDALDKQLKEASRFLDSMNLYTREVRDGWGAALAKRFLYLPLPNTFFESSPVPRIKALTRDFIAICPIAFKRRPLMPREGLYIGRDEMGRRVYWNPSTVPNPHILILGGVGSGKSTLVKTMLFRLHQLVKYSGTGKPPSVIIIDPAGEYADKA
ncbi:MAG: ATP-binding protein, partial [Thaumarchaeota archaeon]|nr:ATP-binding protein [Candidatus Geocrenenecus arthurdayi]